MSHARAAAPLLFCFAFANARAQSVWRDEVQVGSERARYLRFAQLDGTDPWNARDSAARPVPRLRAIRPLLLTSVNTGFPWRSSDLAVWQGRGLNVALTAGAAATLGPLSVRVEPVFAYAANRSFRLENPGAGYFDAMRPGTIDQPQRFGSGPLRTVDGGETYVRLNAAGVTVAFSNERIFWGPGVRHALLFAADAPGFPHLSFGTSGPIATPFGGVSAEVLYAKMSGSAWAPGSAGRDRFGSGFRVAWTPHALPIDLGAARFYHRFWPTKLTGRDWSAPFGAFFKDAQVAASDSADNQLAMAFFRLRLPRARFEVYGEFGRNDRSQGLRDLKLEPEHNSAWLLGAIKTFRRGTAPSFWSVRYEAATGRVSAIQDIGRLQSTFYEHSPVNAGHTQRGLLLGTPLIDRSAGAELAVDRWDERGRLGISILEREMPDVVRVGVTPELARVQWDVGADMVYFLSRGDVSVRIGSVADVNRFPDTNGYNFYLRVLVRGQLGRTLAPSPARRYHQQALAP